MILAMSTQRWQLLQQHLAHPTGIFDPHAALAALE